MEQLPEFVMQHPLLAGAWVIVTVMLITYLLQEAGSGGSRLEPVAAVRLINRESPVIVDIRPQADYRAGHIVEAQNVAEADLLTRVKKLVKTPADPILLYCEMGNSSQRAVHKLKQAGYARAYQISGGVASWQQENLPLVKE